MSIPYIQKRLDKIFDMLDNYKSEIPNPKVKEFKTYMNYAIEDAIRIEDERDLWKWAYHNDVLSPYPHQIKGKIKKVNKLPDSPHKTRWLAIHKEFLDIFDKFSKLKVVKRTDVKKETDKERYVRKLASSEAIKIADKALRQTAERIEKDFVIERIQGIKDMIAKYEKADDKTKYKMRRGNEILSRHQFNKDIDDKAIEKIAKREAENMKEAFLMKNVDKLANILEKKGELKGKPKHTSYRKGDFFGSMRVEFKDGSGFTVVNKVVTKVNFHGTWFHQFPTTFHNVVMPDGSKMKQPSEKRMIEVFAVA